MSPIIIPIFLVEKLFTSQSCTNLFHLGGNSFFFFSTGEHFTRKVSTQQGKQRLTHWWIAMDLAHKQNSWEQVSESQLVGFRGVQLPLEFRENHDFSRADSTCMKYYSEVLEVKTWFLGEEKLEKEKNRKKKKRKERKRKIDGTTRDTCFKLISKRKKKVCTYTSSLFFFF